MILNTINTSASLNSVSDVLSLKEEFSEELYNILNFWESKTIDKEYGGFIGEMNHFGKIEEKASKGGILNARILWTFSAAYRVTKKDSYLKMAERAYRYLIEHFWDTENGGLFWEVDYKGNPINTRKQAYAQGFGIYAFSEYYSASKTKESLEFAKELYQIIESKFLDTEHGGYIEALACDWSAIKDMRLSEKDMNAPKSMNTHLHILEPYTNLYRVWPSEILKNSIEWLITLFSEKIYNKQTKHLNIFFTTNWGSLSDEVSFGHDIEAAWLINEAFLETNKGVLDVKIYNITASLVQSTLNEGLDKDGSLLNNFNNNKYDTDRHWWPQAEALVGLMDAYQLNNNPIYLEHLIKVWKFIKYNIIDAENGEWHWRVNENCIANESEVKVGFWKCPYHNSRALMELIERIENINHVK